jgi:hypothetical protein
LIGISFNKNYNSRKNLPKIKEFDFFDKKMLKNNFAHGIGLTFRHGSQDGSFPLASQSKILRKRLPTNCEVVGYLD